MNTPSATYVNTSGEVRPSLDVQFLNHNTFGDKALRAEIITLFTLQLEQSRSKIVEASSPQDWRFVMHTLKGAAAAVGAMAIVENCEMWERQGLPPDQAAKDFMLSMYDSAHQSFISATSSLQAA